MMALGRDPETVSRKDENVTSGCALEIWTFILGEIVKQGGPFAGYNSIRLSLLLLWWGGGLFAIWDFILGMDVLILI